MNPVKIVRNLSPFGWDVAMKNDCFVPKGESKGDSGLELLFQPHFIFLEKI